MAQPQTSSRLLPRGVYPAAVVFYTDESAKELDFDAIKRHVLRLAEGGSTGILCQGSYSEAQFLAPDERIAIIRAARMALDEAGFADVPIVAGTGSQSTRETVRLTADAAAAGASFALVFTPSTWRPYLTTDHIVEFHREVAESSPIPTLIYNNPTVTAGLDLDSFTISRAGTHPNLVGCKTGHIGALSRLVNKAPDSFTPFISRSDSLFPALCVGGAGGIVGLANLCPKVHKLLWEHFHAGRLDEARQVHRVLSDADDLLGRYGGIGFLKAVVAREFGYGNSAVRKPLAPCDLDKLSVEDQATLKTLIDSEKSL